MWIFNNILYKGVALLLAVALWSIAQGFRDIERSIDIPVSLEGTPEDVVVVAQSSSEINLLVSGSRAAVRRAERQLVRYPISLDGIRPGEARFAVVLDRLDVPRGARISARSPSSVALSLGNSPRGPLRVSYSHRRTRPISHRCSEALAGSRIRPATKNTDPPMYAEFFSRYPNIARPCFFPPPCLTRYGSFPYES